LGCHAQSRARTDIDDRYRRARVQRPDARPTLAEVPLADLSFELFAVNATVPLAHAALKGPEADVPYTAVLSVPLVCVVFQYCCAMASEHCAQIRPAQIAAMTNAWVALRLD
jgi:hypothetical protein